MTVLPADGVHFEITVPVLVIGAGACGLTAALGASEHGAEALVIERDAKPAGSTALSTGLIPAAGTSLQRALQIADDADLFFQDIMAKAKQQTDARIARAVAAASAPTIEWLMQDHGVALRLVEGFLYPGHSRLRMHGTPGRTGAELSAALLAAAAGRGIDILTGAHATHLFANGAGRVKGVRVVRPDGAIESIGCGALVLACNGFGGNPAMVGRYIPEMAEALYFGHVGNQGDAVAWGLALGAAVADMGAYQGHGALAHPHGVPIMWGVLTEGGFQVNRRGERFANEVRGYSEQALDVVRQPDHVAWDIYDARCELAARGFTDYQNALAMGAVKPAESVADLAAATCLPEGALARTMAAVDTFKAGAADDPFGRPFQGVPPLAPPYRAVRVTGALFHTQGGLVVDTAARVLRQDGTPLPNLFAGGGAARGLSGPSRWGYLSGNGLLAATVLGRIAGASAAALVR
ncbi:MAG: FAD-dependent oxidoreductase [Alphaproteobacteria bacterium]|nr:FAD-dependent oxidoreductase [Alphaproteobacteria bacterium]